MRGDTTGLNAQGRTAAEGGGLAAGIYVPCCLQRPAASALPVSQAITRLPAAPGAGNAGCAQGAAPASEQRAVAAARQMAGDPGVLQQTSVSPSCCCCCGCGGGGAGSASTCSSCCSSPWLAGAAAWAEVAVLAGPGGSSCRRLPVWNLYGLGCICAAVGVLPWLNGRWRASAAGPASKCPPGSATGCCCRCGCCCSAMGSMGSAPAVFRLGTASCCNSCSCCKCCCSCCGVYLWLDNLHCVAVFSPRAMQQFLRARRQQRGEQSIGLLLLAGDRLASNYPFINGWVGRRLGGRWHTLDIQPIPLCRVATYALPTLFCWALPEDQRAPVSLRPPCTPPLSP